MKMTSSERSVKQLRVINDRIEFVRETIRKDETDLEAQKKRSLRTIDSN